jgi:hypothetical protein
MFAITSPLLANCLSFRNFIPSSPSTSKSSLTAALTAPECAASDQSLWIGILWWFPALVLAFVYPAIIQRHYSGKVNVSKDNQGLY